MTLAQARNYHLRIQPPGVNSLEKDAEERDFQNGWSDRFDPGASPLLNDIAATEGDAFLCIQTDAVRKGLPVLLASWMAFRKTPEGAKAKLIIKLSTIDVYADFFRVHFLASLAHNAAARRAGIVETGVWFVNERMSEEQIQALFFSCDAYCTATYGEGFGGPIAEALLLGKPVLSPTHTSIIDLLGAEYALAIDSAPHVLALWRNIPIYSPSTVWHIPSDASFTATLCRFSRMTRQERQALAAKAQEGLLARTGAQKVNAVLKQEFDDIFANSRKI
jgi:glycosyltransferase involved in cell wall biosynthesis